MLWSQSAADGHPRLSAKRLKPGKAIRPSEPPRTRVRPARPPGTFPAGRPTHPAFRFVLAGSSVSMLGTKISTLAFPMLILWLGRSPGLAGLSVFATVLPGVLFNFPAGIIVDKVNPWQVMICSEVLRGITAISVVIMLLRYGHHVNIIFLIIAMFAEELLEMFTCLAERRYLNWMMDPEESRERRSQQASIEARAHVAVLTGRPLAPFLFTIGPMAPFLADAASFVFSLLGLLLGEGKLTRLKADRATGPQRLSATRIRDSPESVPGIGEALKSVKYDRTIWLGGPLLSMTSVVSQALILIFLTEANRHQFSMPAIGIALAASGLGGAAGSYLSNFLPDIIRRRWILVQMGSWLVTCGVLAAIGSHSALAAGCTMFIFSVTGSVGNVEFSTHLNLTVKDNMLGKISGISYAISVATSAIGPVIGGFAVQQLGVRNAIFLLFIIVLLLTAGSAFLPPISNATAPSGGTGEDRPIAQKQAAGIPVVKLANPGRLKAPSRAVLASAEVPPDEVHKGLAAPGEHFRTRSGMASLSAVHRYLASPSPSKKPTMVDAERIASHLQKL